MTKAGRAANRPAFVVGSEVSHEQSAKPREKYMSPPRRGPHSALDRALATLLFGELPASRPASRRDHPSMNAARRFTPCPAALAAMPT